MGVEWRQWKMVKYHILVLLDPFMVKKEDITNHPHKTVKTVELNAIKFQ